MTVDDRHGGKGLGACTARLVARFSSTRPADSGRSALDRKLACQLSIVKIGLTALTAADPGTRQSNR
ncbi:hypothetical protein [Rhodovulum sp. MB263]|uniref:hypothetical protein n=1 Tax=Rhodovulum sp. (strain MB263) TaxID=308754 RepID=UPI0012DB7467|nr:hypothetical protein [Rhodovulum sp. MB263]